MLENARLRPQVLTETTEKETLAMKSITTTDAKNKVRLLNAVIGYRRETEKIEKDLKIWVKELMGDDKAVIVGEFLITLRTQSRKDLDRDALKLTLGDLEPYEKETVYEVLNLETFHKNRGKL